MGKKHHTIIVSVALSNEIMKAISKRWYNRRCVGAVSQNHHGDVFSKWKSQIFQSVLIHENWTDGLACLGGGQTNM